MRCPDCNKFVPFNADEEPEVNISIDDDATISGDVRIVNLCEECGTELSETSFDIDIDCEELCDRAHTGDAPCQGVPWKGEEGHELSFSNEDADRTVTQTGRGRGIRTFYGAEATWHVTCLCGAEFDVEWSDRCQSSYMDPLV